ncbi:SRPBCC domain-containing protein [Dyadobacter tibetensis]|uniref:SRPBCC domain-containing protein n=1 Tax=Dyadobacter tibetensis TaxID=1211851 RepID=UPI000471161F|nr:SRPBCC domain-containing protein [Dyadobacter tibetensis]
MGNLKTISFSISINAPREKIWEVLWQPKTYEKWTKVFMEGSHYQGDLKPGHTIDFLGKNGNGIRSLVERLVVNEQMVFSHQAELKEGVETTSSWKGAKEIYFLKQESETSVELQAVMDITLEMEEYFNEAFPKALRLIKQYSES